MSRRVRGNHPERNGEPVRARAWSRRGGVRAGALLVGLAWSVVPRAAAAQQHPSSDDCIACHLTLDEPRLVQPAKDFPSDIHAEKGFDCLACHGRVPAGAGGGAMDPSKGFIARPTRAQIPELCGSCHSDIEFMKRYNPSLRVDQLAEYWTSRHGKALREGDPDVATCVSCHPAHSIRPPSDPESSVYPTHVAELCGSCHSDAAIMGPRGLPTDQLEEYRGSVHGRQMIAKEDISAPTCNDCHGNHGAAPPGVASVQRVCGQCHAVMADDFHGTGHDQAFSDAGYPGCETCHGNHGIQTPSDADLPVRAREVCSRCHEPGDTAAAAFDVILVLIDSLEVERARAKDVLDRAANLGMEVSQAQFELQDVNNALARARAAVHTFSADPVRTEVSGGLEIVSRSMKRGNDALWEHGFRRAGLGVSALFILLFMVGLVLKIREIERRPDSRAPSHDPRTRGKS